MGQLGAEHSVPQAGQPDFGGSDGPGTLNRPIRQIGETRLELRNIRGMDLDLSVVDGKGQFAVSEGFTPSPR